MLWLLARYKELSLGTLPRVRVRLENPWEVNPSEVKAGMDHDPEHPRINTVSLIGSDL